MPAPYADSTLLSAAYGTPSAAQAGGSDLWPVTWDANGDHISAWGDGGGFGGDDSTGRVSLGIARIEGTQGAPTYVNVNGGVSPESGNTTFPAENTGKSNGIVSVDGTLLMIVQLQDGNPPTTKIYHSEDGGATWAAHAPVWPVDTSLRPIGFINFGQDYAGARDAYLYLIGRDGLLGVFSTDIHLMRVLKTQVNTQAAYEYFSGLDGNGRPTWSTDPTARSPIFSDPNGFLDAMSMTYVGGDVNRYLLSVPHSDGAGGTQSLRQFGMFEAEEPWGPWKTVVYTDTWLDATADGLVFVSSHIPRKWVSADGLTVPLVFSGTGTYDAWHTVTATLTVATPAQGTTVDVDVENPEDFDQVQQPATSGVPLPKGAVTDVDEVHLRDPGGDLVPVQKEVRGTWGDGSIKWIGLDFLADVSASSTATYTADYGNAGNDPHHVQSIALEDSAGALVVNTGAGLFTISKTAFNLFDRVVVGGRELVAAGNAGGLHLSPSAAGAPVYDVDEDAVDSDSTDNTPTVEIELEGPLHTIVKVQGDLYATGSPEIRMGYTVRLHFYAGLGAVRAETRLENLTLYTHWLDGFGQPWGCYDIGKDGSVSFSKFAFNLAHALTGTRTYAMRGETATPTTGTLGTNVLLYQDSSGGDYWNRHVGIGHEPYPSAYVTFRGYKVYEDGVENGGAAGNRALGWIDLEGDEGGITVGVKDLWQNFPKALEADASALSVGLFPDQYGKDFNFRVGDFKTHAVNVFFHAPGVGNTVKDRQMRAFQSPLQGIASLDHHRATEALGPIAPLQTGTDYDTEIDLTLQPHGQYGGAVNCLVGSQERYDFYNAWVHGNVILDYEGDASGANGQTNLKYNLNWGFLVQYLRTRNRAYLDLGARGNQAIADWAILHAVQQGSRAPYTGHWAANIYFGHSGHDEQGFHNPCRNGNEAAGTSGLNPDVGFGPPGLFLGYYLTGDRWWREEGLRNAEAVQWRCENNIFEYSGGGGHTQQYGNGQGYASNNSRACGNMLWIFVAAYELTGDTAWLDTAEIIVAEHNGTEAWIDWIPLGNTKQSKPWQDGIFCTALGRYLDRITEIGRADTYDAAGSLAAFADWLATLLTDSPAGALELWSVGDDPTIGGTQYQTQDPANYPHAWGSGSVGNWNIGIADALAYAYKHTGNPAFLVAALALFIFGMRFPWYCPTSGGGAGNPNWTSDFNISYNLSAQLLMNALVLGNAYLDIADAAQAERGVEITGAGSAAEGERHLDLIGRGEAEAGRHVGLAGAEHVEADRTAEISGDPTSVAADQRAADLIGWAVASVGRRAELGAGPLAAPDLAYDRTTGLLSGEGGSGANLIGYRLYTPDGAGGWVFRAFAADAGGGFSLNLGSYLVPGLNVCMVRATDGAQESADSELYPVYHDGPAVLGQTWGSGALRGVDAEVIGIGASGQEWSAETGGMAAVQRDQPGETTGWLVPLGPPWLAYDSATGILTADGGEGSGRIGYRLYRDDGAGAWALETAAATAAPGFVLDLSPHLVPGLNAFTVRTTDGVSESTDGPVLWVRSGGTSLSQVQLGVAERAQAVGLRAGPTHRPHRTVAVRAEVFDVRVVR